MENTKTTNPCVYIVAGLLYGDEGKGTTVEFLAKEKKSNLVVRYNGGPQAAHHIVLPDKTFHCFSQFGSASFKDSCHTLISKYMLIYPHTMIREANKLIDNGLIDISKRMHIDQECFIITPYHQMINRMSEILRGGKKHGSTGLGVGVCADEAFQAFPEFFPNGEIFYDIDSKRGNIQTYTCLQVSDLLNLDRTQILNKINKIISEKIQQAKNLIINFTSHQNLNFNKEYFEIYKNEIVNNLDKTKNEDILNEAHKYFYDCISIHTSNTLIKFYTQFVQDYRSAFCNGSEIIKERLECKENIIFEGAQGALLDRVYGIYPHLTKTLCTDENALNLLNEVKTKYSVDFEVVKIGVLRAYSSRHGNGPFITHEKNWNEFLKEDHNMNTMWQGEFKVGPFDLIGAKYGIEIFKPDFLSITCLDRLFSASDLSNSIAELPICVGYYYSKEVGEINDDDKAILYDKSDGKLFNIIEENIVSENNQFVCISEIFKRKIEDAYFNLNLLKILKNCIPKIEPIKNFGSDADRENIDFESLKMLSTIKFDENKYKLLYTYLRCIQKLLNLPIGIISLGPTQLDKVCLF